MLKKLILSLTCLCVILLTITSCAVAKGNNNLETNKVKKTLEDDKVKIVTTLFPQYDFTRQIAKDKADIIMLLQPGVESHSYEPTPADIIKINSSDLFIYTGEYMEAWAERLISGIDNNSITILDISKDITLVKSEEEEEEHEHEEEEHLYDPHIWTDPNNAIIIVDSITKELCKIDENNADYYKANAEEYKKELLNLDSEFRQVVENSKRKEIIFGGRNAFYYFLNRYNIEYQSAYDSCYNQTEPNVKIIANLITKIKNENIPVIYYEELANPKVAQSISDETGAKMLLLHSTHNVSKDDFKNDITYLDIMKQNLNNLKEGLK